MSPRDVPLSHDEARAAAERILDLPGAEGVEVVIAASDTGLTRYAVSEIIQNTVRREVRAYVRVALNDRAATATTNQLSDASMKATAQRALEAANASPPDPDFPGLPDPDVVGRAESCFRWDDATQAAPASKRAEAVQEILRATDADNAAGIFETSAHCFGVFSSGGIDCFDAYTRCCTTCLVDLGNATGWSESWGHAISDVDVAATAKSAAKKAAAGGDPIDIEPAAFEVVLEPPAVATLLEYLSYSGFGAKQVLEGESFLATKTGSSVAAPHITVADDVIHPGSIGIGFDLEGIPKQRVAVIDSGTATGPVTDLRTARKMGTQSTGHASGSNEFGPYAFNIVLEGGDQTKEELIGGVKDGLLVTRFHYVNILDRPETLLTGMTRDGTFRIVDGEIAQPVHNLRFTQSVLEALASAVAVGSEVQTFGPEWGAFGSTATPALRIGEFRFTSATSH